MLHGTARLEIQYTPCFDVAPCVDVDVDVCGCLRDFSNFNSLISVGDDR